MNGQTYQEAGYKTARPLDCDPKAASQSAVVAILSGELREVADEAKSEDQLNMRWLIEKSSLDFIGFSLALYMFIAVV